MPDNCVSKNRSKAADRQHLHNKRARDSSEILQFASLVSNHCINDCKMYEV